MSEEKETYKLVFGNKSDDLKTADLKKAMEELILWPKQGTLEDGTPIMTAELITKEEHQRIIREELDVVLAEMDELAARYDHVVVNIKHEEEGEH